MATVAVQVVGVASGEDIGVWHLPSTAAVGQVKSEIIAKDQHSAVKLLHEDNELNDGMLLESLVPTGAMGLVKLVLGYVKLTERFCTIGGWRVSPAGLKVMQKSFQTLQEAERLCSSLPGCKGFTYNAEAATDSVVEVSFFEKSPCFVRGHYGQVQNVCFYLQSVEDTQPVIERILQTDGSVLQDSNTSTWLRGDRQIMLAACQMKAALLAEASEELRNDAVLVKRLVQQRPHTLQHASHSLRSDPTFMTEILKDKPAALMYASDELRSDAQFIRGLVRTNDVLLGYACDSLRKDKGFIWSIVEEGFPQAIRHAWPSLWEDADLMLHACSKDASAIRHVGLNAWKNKAFATRMVQASWKNLLHASEEVRSDRGIAKIALQQAPESLQFLSDILKEDPEIVYMVYSKAEDVALKYARENVFRERDFCLAVAGKKIPVEWTMCH